MDNFSFRFGPYIVQPSFESDKEEAIAKNITCLLIEKYGQINEV